jgi:hypothetical protein
MQFNACKLQRVAISNFMVFVRLAELTPDDVGNGELLSSLLPLGFNVDPIRGSNVKQAGRNGAHHDCRR